MIARIFQKHPDLICGEIRAIATEMSEFVRMRSEEKSCFACCLLLLNKVFEHFRRCMSGFIRMVDAKKSGQSPRGSRNLSGCEIRICPENPDAKCKEIRAITSGISEFVRMRNPDLSGKSGCEIRRNSGNHITDIRICPGVKSELVWKIGMTL